MHNKTNFKTIFRLKKSDHKMLLYRSLLNQKHKRFQTFFNKFELHHFSHLSKGTTIFH